MILSGQPAEAAARARQIFEGLDEEDRLNAILAFLMWLSNDPETSPQAILDEIELAGSEANFNWSFREIAPFIAALPPSRRALAQSFIDYFEGRSDLETLKTAVAAS